MSNSEDRRVKMTKKILKHALIELLKEKPIHEINIKKICETADINRSTFYHHYQSPRDLYDDIIEDIKNDFNVIIQDSLKRKLNKNEIACALFTHIEANRELMLVVLSANGNVGVGQKLCEIVDQYVDTSNQSDLSAYCTHFISAGLAQIVWLWLNKEDRLPPKTMAELIVTIITNGLSRAIAFSSSEVFGLAKKD